MNPTTVEQLLQSGVPMTTRDALPILRKCVEWLDKLGGHERVTPARIGLGTNDPGSEVETESTPGEVQVLQSVAGQTLPPPGNAAYLSPEEIIGTPPDARSTEFSLAVIAYEMLTGYKPFTGPNLSALVYDICAGTPLAADVRNPKLNGALASVLQRALAKEPQQRFQSCRAFVSALEQAAKAGEPEAALATAASAAGVRTAATQQTAVQPDAPIPSSFPELPARRRRLLVEDEPYPVPSTESRSSRLLRIGAFPTALIGIAAALLLVLLLDRHSMPSIPQQTVDPRVGPIAPPPPPDENSEDDESRTVENRIADARAANTRTGPSAFPQGNSATPAPRQAGTDRSVPSQIRPQPASRSSSPQLGGPGEGSVELLTEPPGGMVVVDGHSGKSCTAPCTVLLSAGRHVLSAHLDGYAIAQRIFNTPEDSSLIISLSPNLGTLIVSSSPPGAVVSVDGRQAGQSPLTLHLRPGRHRLAAVYGNQYRQQFIDLQPDTIVGATFDLQ